MLTFWADPLPGAEPAVADRLVALHCAAKLTSSPVVASGASEAGELTTPARKFEDWLGESTSEQDRIIRRVVLLIVCDKTDPDTPVSRIRALANELHHYVTRR